jgi:hypothetical protein
MNDASKMSYLLCLCSLSCAAASGGKGVLAADELQAFKLVGAALLVGYAEVYDALEMAARLVFTRSCEAGQQFVAHR